jgi:hypothetical protein
MFRFRKAPRHPGDDEHFILFAAHSDNDAVDVLSEHYKMPLKLIAPGGMFVVHSETEQRWGTLMNWRQPVERGQVYHL